MNNEGAGSGCAALPGLVLALGDVTVMLFWLVIDGWQGRAFHTLVLI